MNKTASTKKMTALWIKTDGTEQEVSPKNGRHFKLDELYHYIKTLDRNDDPMAQLVPLTTIRESYLVCEENGISLNLPSNHTATLKLALDVILGPVGIQGNVLICPTHLLE